MADEKFKMGLKNKLPNVLSEGLWKCSKIKATFELKDNADPVFKPKAGVPFAALESINKELDRLENLRIISSVDYSEWSAQTIYVKKKNSKIRVCANYSTD